MTKILVTGGAGYIGSHMVKQLCLAGFDVVVLDDLSGGCADAVQGRRHKAELVVGSIGDATLLVELFNRHSFAGVMNFASFIQVGESVAQPLKYYQNNVANTLILLDAMQRHGVSRFIFSSTAATFGNPEYVPMNEVHTQVPINPYGHSKLMIEQVLSDIDAAYGFKSVCLRYFNAAGADPEGELGERHEPETHLIPLVLQAASGRRNHISVFGTDYATPDGTCLRDYIHVEDLCSAHLLALQHLLKGGESRRYNLGNGTGFSVKEVIDIVSKVTGKPINVTYEPRRAGDPPRLVADSQRIRTELGWRPQRADLATIVSDAWAWERKWPWSGA